MRQERPVIPVSLGRRAQTDHGFQVTAGLAPQLVPHAKARCGQQQVGIFAVGLEPGLRFLELLCRIGGLDEPEKAYELAPPVRLERCREFLFGTVVQAHTHQAAVVGFEQLNFALELFGYVRPRLIENLGVHGLVERLAMHTDSPLVQDFRLDLPGLAQAWQ